MAQPVGRVALGVCSGRWAGRTRLGLLEGDFEDHQGMSSNEFGYAVVVQVRIERAQGGQVSYAPPGPEALGAKADVVLTYVVLEYLDGDLYGVGPLPPESTEDFLDFGNAPHVVAVDESSVFSGGGPRPLPDSV
jgi:hypothetical protein